MGIWNANAAGIATARLWIQFVFAAPNVTNPTKQLLKLETCTFIQLAVAIKEVRSDAKNVRSVLFSL